jgi:hypothetical protein
MVVIHNWFSISFILERFILTSKNASVCWMPSPQICHGRTFKCEKRLPVPVIQEDSRMITEVQKHLEHPQRSWMVKKWSKFKCFKSYKKHHHYVEFGDSVTMTQTTPQIEFVCKRYDSSCISLLSFMRFVTALRAFGCPSCQLVLHFVWVPLLPTRLALPLVAQPWPVSSCVLLRLFVRLGAHVEKSPCIVLGHPSFELALRCVRAPNLGEGVLKILPLS